MLMSHEELSAEASHWRKFLFSTRFLFLHKVDPENPNTTRNFSQFAARLRSQVMCQIPLEFSNLKLPPERLVDFTMEANVDGATLLGIAAFSWTSCASSNLEKVSRNTAAVCLLDQV